jgi:hypothetical protein
LWPRTRPSGAALSKWRPGDEKGNFRIADFRFQIETSSDFQSETKNLKSAIVSDCFLVAAM